MVTCSWVCNHQEGSAGSWCKSCKHSCIHCWYIAAHSRSCVPCCHLQCVSSVWISHSHTAGAALCLWVFRSCCCLSIPGQRQHWVKASSVAQALWNIPKEWPLLPLINILCNTEHHLLRPVSGLPSDFP